MSTPSGPRPDDARHGSSAQPPRQGGGAGSEGGPPPWQRGTAGGSTQPERGGSSPQGRPGGSSRAAVAEGRPAPDTRGSSGIDAPTSQIRRADAPADLPDLSKARRTGTDAPRSAQQGRGREEGGRPVASVRTTGRGPRRASLQIKHVDPWSMLKLSLVLSVALFLVWMIAVGVLYLVLDGLNVWDRINQTFTDFVTVSDPGTANQALIGPGRVFSVAGIVGLVNIVLFTALTTVSSFVYNISADLAGGVELTLTERD